MRLPQREPDRPPRAAADPSTPPAVTRFSATTSPVDWLSRAGGARKYGGRRWFVPGRYDLTASGCCADRHPVRGDALRNNVEGCAGAPAFHAMYMRMKFEFLT